MTNETESAGVEPLPCPICGGDELSHGFVAGAGVGWGTAGCEACDLQITKDTEAEAISAWNTRATAEAGKRELVEALRPFAAVIDENVPVGIALPSVADYRRARATLVKHGDPA